MAKYKYTGKQSFAATLRYQQDGKPVTQDVQLAKDEQADLPEDHATVKAMVASGLLQPLDNINKPTK